MKLTRAVVKPHKLDPVHAALVEVGVTDLTASEVKGFDRQMGHAEMHRGQDDDGKISVCEVVGTRRIHGGETGEAAL